MSLTLARRFAALGLSVIPVPPPRAGVPANTPGDGKVPAIAWGQYQRRHPTAEELEAWFGGAPMNLAVVTGTISGVIVIDADCPIAVRWLIAHLPYTPWQTKTSRGFHLWYRHPGVRVPNRAKLETRDGTLAIDVRGDGGFVIAPGSRHSSGFVYAEAGHWERPRDEVPVFWPGWLARPRRPSPSTDAGPRVHMFSGDVIVRARAYLAAIPTPEIGCGSDTATLTAACRLVRGFALSAAEAEALLWDWAGGREGWTREWIAQKVAHAVRYGTEPIGALR